MSDEFSSFVEESVDAEVEEVEQPEPEQEVAEVEPEPEQEPETPEPEAEEEGSPTEPDAQEPDKEPWTKTAYMDEKRKRQALERELEELRANKQSEQKPAPDVFEDPEGYTSHLQTQLSNEVWATKVELSQDMMRSLHEDYDQMEAKFLEMGKESPELFARMRQAPNPARFVYETSKKAEKLEQLENVDEWESKKTAELEERLRKQLTEELAAKFEQKAKQTESLTPSLTNTRADGGNREVVSIPDPLESTFNR